MSVEQTEPTVRTSAGTMSRAASLSTRPTALCKAIGGVSALQGLAQLL